MRPPPEVVFEPLGPEHDRSAFACGEPALDDYLRRRAGQDVRRRVARTFVAVDPANRDLVGYYTLSAASFSRDHLPDAVAKRLPHYPVPAAILGRLAVGQKYQGRGLGELLLADAIKRVLRASEALAVHAIVVDAKNDRVKGFDERYGFTAYLDAPNRVYLPLDTVLKARPGDRAARIRSTPA